MSPINKPRKPHMLRFGKNNYYSYYGTVKGERERKKVRKELKKKGYSIRTLRWKGKGGLKNYIDVYRRKRDGK